jgi:hypothetical protein
MGFGIKGFGKVLSDDSYMCVGLYEFVNFSVSSRLSFKTQICVV